MEIGQLQSINARIAGCHACALAKGRTRTVPGDGDPTAELMFIGEGPGFYEDQQGSPFVGRAGALLDELLARIGMTRADVFVTNVVKCRPPNNRDPEPSEIAACEPYLTEQIGGIRPKLIVTLGRFAMQYFVPGAAMGRSHGKVIQSGVHRVYPVYHPAAALRQGALARVLREDFDRIPALLATSERPAAQATAAAPTGRADPAKQLSLL
ncbi:MAG: uracil-DNA glycosylase [Chloroflexi bacterium]|nr:uracil-DNA glycosylase [Chloroflexota bacterium]